MLAVSAAFRSSFVSSALAVAALAACQTEPSPQDEATWEVVAMSLPAALVAVWGTSSQDVWAVGGDVRDGTGPLVLHFDGQGWERLETGEAQGNLWWVFGFEGGPVYMGGEGGVILRYEDGAFSKMATPGSSTVFGIWGASRDDVWAVGGDSSALGGFAWRLEGDAWVTEPTLPPDVPATGALWKAFGTDEDDVWVVGSNGLALHWDGDAFEDGDTGVGASLFTVHASEGRYAAVGGAATGIVVEYVDGSWSNVTPDPPPAGLSGVTLGQDDFGVAVGAYGGIMTRSRAGWSIEQMDVSVPVTLHGSWIDERGEVWVVGGQVSTPPYDDGVLLHRGVEVPEIEL